MTVSPRYDQYKDAWDTSVSVEVSFLIFKRHFLSLLCISNCRIFFKNFFSPSSYVHLDSHLQIKIGDRIETVRFFHSYKRGVDRVFVDHPMFLEKVGKNLQ